MSQANILLIYAHPASQRSRVNHRLVDVAQGIPNVHVNDLYENYPDFLIDVEREQALLKAADLIIFQHPVQWYGMPSLLKEWIDAVLQQGWARGSDGNALHGKDCWLVLSTGGTVNDYRDSGQHGYPLSAFLTPFLQTAKLCGMHWMQPYVLYGADKVNESKVQAHCQRFHDLLSSYPAWAAELPAVLAATPSEEA
ncbi:NAD(P)H-dependent oxidoreductase [Undibacterium sp.]|jgi:putative NADPH-quinone reductase|uniref:glutathione-regulated potassium-efflux system oxidoreductase KefF n=1 Tax=Undibacterium sp. TaxID=1914977 RepID=UPI002C5F1F86|nr:NAD(P)H-dependent oxidoreductase [Undibacterium sp.]HTD04964.1 NAD(P)H-dependent oxidoreductase [Undibacterium sp.]